ncbi:heavy metal translocating P-type ATPase [Helicobacter cholecystus]|uniref:heavy metal translocating P-type ATPase n=1 Tax=Helicobacter cholecystus TaxID=45498 RepID=UPI0027396441|nr:cation-translocating P-type ATPase [Helicobacter cholecystus]
MKEIIYIEGMTCSACSSGIERSLKRKAFIKNVQVDLLNKLAIIEFDEQTSSLDEIFTLIKKLGYIPKKQGRMEKLDSAFLTPKRRILIALIFTFLTLYLSMLPMISLSFYQWLTPISPFYNALLQMFFTLIVMHMGRNFYIKGFSSLLSLNPTMDTLVMLGSGGAFIFSLFTLPSLYHSSQDELLLLHSSEGIYFESVCVILLFVLIGKSLEEQAKNNTQHSLKTLASLKDAFATRINNKTEERVEISQIKRGDILKISPQESIPVDGIITQGYANLDCSSLSGESMPIGKKEGEEIYSGSFNLNTTFLMQANKDAQNSTYWQILNLVQNALISKAPIAKLADKISAFFIPFVILLACLSSVIWFLISHDAKVALQTFCTILLISCPCALGLATPLALNIATKLASARGVFFKDAQILELIGKTSLIFFDKTGTLTQKQLSLKKIISFGSVPEDQLLQICASLESQSQHIIAQSILQASQEQNLSLLESKEIHIQEGLGISGEIGGIRYKIGSAKNFSPSPSHSEDGIEVFIGKEHQDKDEILGCILLEEKLKNETKQSIIELKNLGVSATILSGDHAQNVQKIANELGIAYRADALPQDKLEILKSHKDEITMMVGDGINDMLALSNANISVSMGEGAKGAMASSNLIIFNNNLSNIPYVIKLSNATLKNIKQNLFWAFGYNACMIPIACGVLSIWGITLTPVLASSAMTLSSLSVVLNAQRLKKFKG